MLVAVSAAAAQRSRNKHSSSRIAICRCAGCLTTGFIWRERKEGCSGRERKGEGGSAMMRRRRRGWVKLHTDEFGLIWFDWWGYTSKQQEQALQERREPWTMNCVSCFRTSIKQARSRNKHSSSRYKRIGSNLIGLDCCGADHISRTPAAGPITTTAVVAAAAAAAAAAAGIYVSRKS